MPRKSRIDAPGALHHIIARGIDRRQIFENGDDRNHFLSRLDLSVTAVSKAVTRGKKLMKANKYSLVNK